MSSLAITIILTPILHDSDGFFGSAALADGLRQRREQLGLTQAQAAQRCGSSQSRVAKMEVGDPSVSLDLIVRSLLALGASSEDLATAIRAA